MQHTSVLDLAAALIGAGIAAVIGIYCARAVAAGLSDGRLSVGWWPSSVVERDAAPFSFWWAIARNCIGVFCCGVVAAMLLLLLAAALAQR